jgi:hypothetical protein
MDSVKQLTDELFLDKVRVAKATDPADRFFDGARLFHRVCRTMTDGIRDRFPEASEEEVRQKLLELIAIGKRLEKRQ